jgi:hypothetical protein
MLFISVRRRSQVNKASFMLNQVPSDNGSLKNLDQVDSQQFRESFQAYIIGPMIITSWMPPIVGVDIG